MQNATPQRKCFVPIASIIGGISIILLTFTYLLFESKSYSNDRIRLPYSNYFISVVEFAPDLGVECTLLAGMINTILPCAFIRIVSNSFVSNIR